MKTYHLIYWYLCLKSGCGIKEHDNEDFTFKAENLEAAKVIARKLFEKTKTGSDAWHFCYSVRLIASDIKNKAWNYNWPDKVKIVEEYYEMTRQYERPINWSYKKELLLALGLIS